MSTIGTVWETDTWEDDAWEGDTWGNIEDILASFTQLRPDKYISIQNMSSESFNETLDKDWESQDWPNE